MGECFHGWRRKMGCVTLVVACFLFGIWMRSQFITDSHLFLGSYFAQSQSGQFSILQMRIVPDTPLPLYDATIDISQIWSVNYLALVAPLTLLAAYLILWKPRKSPAKPVVDGAG